MGLRRDNGDRKDPAGVTCQKFGRAGIPEKIELTMTSATSDRRLPQIPALASRTIAVLESTLTSGSSVPVTPQNTSEVQFVGVQQLASRHSLVILADPWQFLDKTLTKC